MKLALRGVTIPLLLLGLAAPVVAQEPVPGLDAFIQRSMSAWEVPGLAIAIVRGDSIILARGYGVRELGRPEPVDEHTVFAIASITKSFTSAGVGILIDEGRVALDDRANLHLPYLEFADPWVTRNFTIRDMLSHRAGVERGDWLWFGTDFDRDEVVRRIRYLRPAGAFRADYGYSNNMYIAAGQMIAAVTGRSWDDFMHERLFVPLGMSRTNTSVRHLAGMDNVAKPHEKLNGRMQVVPHGNLDNEAPGGSINSSVMDMAQWIRFQLRGGTVDGRTILQPATLAEAHTPQTLNRITELHRYLYPDVHFLTYGLGWEILNYRGRKLVQHSGAFDGMRSRLSMLPAEDLGIVILTNRGWGNMLEGAVRNYILDALLLGEVEQDWSAHYLARVRQDEAEASAYEARIRSERVPGTSPSLPPAGYAGTYVNDAFGTATVAVENGRLVLTLGPRHTSELEHYHHNTWWAAWRNPALGWSLVTFVFAHDGSVSAVDVGGVAQYRRQQR